MRSLPLGTCIAQRDSFSLLFTDIPPTYLSWYAMFLRVLKIIKKAVFWSDEEFPQDHCYVLLTFPNYCRGMKASRREQETLFITKIHISLLGMSAELQDRVSLSVDPLILLTFPNICN
jgi:hypothetical protein